MGYGELEYPQFSKGYRTSHFYQSFAIFSQWIFANITKLVLSQSIHPDLTANMSHFGHFSVWGLT